MRKLTLFALLLILPCLPAHSHMKKEAMSSHGAKGGCAKYKLALKKELALWKLPAVSPDGFALPVGKKIKFHLTPESSIVLPVEPNIVYESHTFTGDLTFQAAKEGIYRISLGAHIWISAILDDGHQIDPSHVEMQSNCGAIKKFAEFPFKADTKYLIHISDSKKDTQELLLTETGK